MVEEVKHQAYYLTSTQAVTQPLAIHLNPCFNTTMIKADNQLTQDAILADIYCAQVQTAVDQGDSVFNIDTYPELTGDDYADKMMEGIIM